MSSWPTLGKIFSMTGGVPLRIVTFALPQDRVRPDFRTLWKPLSNRMERKSFLLDFFSPEIRTCRKSLNEIKVHALMKHLIRKGFSRSASSVFFLEQFHLPFRTLRKLNSYRSDFFQSLIRTCRNFIRTLRKEPAEIIREMRRNTRSINTFLFISKKKGEMSL